MLLTLELCYYMLHFCLYGFVEAATLRSIVLRYAGAPIATWFFFWEMSLFPSIFCTISAFSLYPDDFSVQPMLINFSLFGWMLRRLLRCVQILYRYSLDDQYPALITFVSMLWLLLLVQNRLISY